MNLQRQVEQRSGGRCEYCRMHQALQGATFHLEHVVPISLGGESTIDNLAWACPRCNLSKANRTKAADPETGDLAILFHPRQQTWEDHFEWHGYRLHGLTSSGRATIAALDLNHPRRILIRTAEEMFDLFPQ